MTAERVVPTEPTKKMLSAGYQSACYGDGPALSDDWPEAMTRIYKAMLAAYSDQALDAIALRERVEAAEKDAGYLWHALKDLSFDCDGVTQTQAPQIGTYNSIFTVLEALTSKYQTFEHYQKRAPNEPAIDAAIDK